MSCDYCHHCQALADPATFVLPDRPGHSTAAGANTPFYRAFGGAYDHARRNGLRPRTAIMGANPWMTEAQYSAYLKRARAMALVSSGPRASGVSTAERRTAPPAVRVEAAPRHGRSARTRGRRTAGPTPEQCEEIWLHRDVIRRMRNCELKGTPLTVELLCQAAPGKLTEAQAQAVLEFAVATGMAAWVPDGTGVLYPEGAGD